MEEEVKQEVIKHPYKIMYGDEITVHRNDVISNENQYTFYHTNIKKKTKGGKDLTFKKELSFKAGTDIEDGTIIKVLDFFEDARLDKNNKYYPIWKLVITDYEIIQEASAYRTEQDEIESYQEQDPFV